MQMNRVSKEAFDCEERIGISIPCVREIAHSTDGVSMTTLYWQYVHLNSNTAGFRVTRDGALKKTFFLEYVNVPFGQLKFQIRYGESSILVHRERCHIQIPFYVSLKPDKFIHLLQIP